MASIAEGPVRFIEIHKDVCLVQLNRTDDGPSPSVAFTIGVADGNYASFFAVFLAASIHSFRVKHQTKVDIDPDEKYTPIDFVMKS